MKNVKELVKGIDLMMEGLALVKGSLEGAEPVADKKVDKKADKKAEPKEEENGSDDRRAELEEMSYNSLKALVSSLGGKAVGKKPDLIDLILELEGEESEDTEEEVEDKAKDTDKGSKKADKEADKDDEEEDEEDGEELSEVEMRAEISEFELDELKDIAKHMKLKFKAKATKKQLIDAVLEDLDALDQALEALGYYEEDEDDEEDSNDVNEEDNNEEDKEDGEDEEGEESVSEALNGLNVEQLADICSDYDLSTKGKKQALIDRILEAIENGDIDESELFSDEEDAEDEDSEEVDVEEVVNGLELDDLKDVSKELGIKVKKSAKEASLKKSILAKDAEDILDALVDLELVDAEEEVEVEDEDSEDNDGNTEDVEVSEEVTEAEDAVEKDIRAKYKKKKLKDSQIKKFLEKYYDGDPDCSDCKGCSKEELLECYIKIQRSLVDDDCEKHKLNDYYERGEVEHCCGKVLKELENGNLYCSVCGEEYEVEE